jgi:DDE superfamily endonuclease
VSGRGIPDDAGFVTKPQLALRMIARAIAAEVSFGWAAADEVYGGNGPLRTWWKTTRSAACWPSRMITAYPPAAGQPGR